MYKNPGSRNLFVVESLLFLNCRLFFFKIIGVTTVITMLIFMNLPHTGHGTKSWKNPCSSVALIKNCVFNPGFHHGGRRVCGRGMLEVKYEEKNSKH